MSFAFCSNTPTMTNFQGCNPLGEIHTFRHVLLTLPDSLAFLYETLFFSFKNVNLRGTVSKYQTKCTNQSGLR